MALRKVCFAALLGLCCSWCTAEAQNPYAPANMPAPLTKGKAPAAPTENVDEPGTGLSSWITYDRNNCCMGAGGGMPILTELVFRVGPSFPVGGEYFSRNMDIGWMVEGGARAMFFNHGWTAAWAFEFGVSNTFNPSHSPETTLLDHNINATVSLQSIDRTFANFVVGREWYVGNPANSDEWHVRVGGDFGGRWGAATARFNGLPQNFNNARGHVTGVIEGIVVAAHVDLEVPCGHCTFIAGLRGEYAFTWSTILAPGQGDVEDMTFLVNLGVRY